MSAQCDVIIPFYDEGPRLLSLLRTVSTCTGIGRIICVDDGSGNSLRDDIMRAHPRVTLLVLPKNRGKSDAVREGLKIVRTPYVLLLDADTVGLQSDEIDAAVSAIVSDPGTHMIILSKIYSPFSSNWLRADTVLGGDRVLKTADLHTVFEEYKPIRYRLEIAVNMYMNRHGKIVRWLPSSAINDYKTGKRGLVRGLRQDIAMHLDIIRYAGLFEYLRQDLFFCRTRWSSPDIR